MSCAFLFITFFYFNISIWMYFYLSFVSSNFSTSTNLFITFLCNLLIRSFPALFPLLKMISYNLIVTITSLAWKFVNFKIW